MRKSLVIFLMLLLSAVIAQHASAQLVYGVKAGYTGYKLTGSDVYGGMNYVYNPSFGANLGIKFTTDFQLQFEFLYLTKGVHQLFTHKQTIHAFEQDTVQITIADVKKYDNTLKMNYLEVPVYLRKSFSLKGGVWPYDRKIGRVDFDLFLGGYFGYRFGGTVSQTTLWKQDITKRGITTPGTEVKYDTNSFFIGQNITITSVDSTYPKEMFIPYVPTNKPSASKDLAPFDAGIIVGAGFSLEVSEHAKLTLDMRYTMGLLTIDKTYFNDIEYLFTPDGSGLIQIAGNNFSMTTRRTKMDVKNSGIGLFLGYTYYLE
ncbi:MAG TPA: outer membrane beta-barrel protein [Bacteroidia bacterium]|nr:PorT family protein [Sphingobacteriales bacterium]HPD64799.1 outer membrane beta-barrel protein [Bacteroidia bacterium]HRS59202.1 outer membrane beta-barrel protein [Bacteroidia bacterium]HRU67250.1 outer membrane beta-barrel protein [Bacteroidia bacterium]